MVVDLWSIIIQGLQHCVLPLKTLELGHFSFQVKFFKATWIILGMNHYRS